ncbi:hypothetical protein BDR03DRAFT_962048 [Suillus americanus]|nr:hypothetical protein BDR03DRAFT_962048 [Suillus americanus]
MRSVGFGSGWVPSCPESINGQIDLPLRSSLCDNCVISFVLAHITYPYPIRSHMHTSAPAYVQKIQ